MRSRSPPHTRFPEQPVDTRPLPENWIVRSSNNVEPGRIYYFNGLTGESRWDPPDPDEERRRSYAENQERIQLLQDARRMRIQRAEAAYQARIQGAEAARQARNQRQEALHASILRAEAARQAVLEDEEEDREKLYNVTNGYRILNNRDYAEHQERIQFLQEARRARIHRAETERRARIHRAETEREARNQREEARRARMHRLYLDLQNLFL
jgi:regulator of protease activity HflC (stomatin/prohibitin superfamily)